MTDHGSFVLLNVYVPNAGDRPARTRLPAKIEFLRQLKQKMDELVEEGRQVGGGVVFLLEQGEGRGKWIGGEGKDSGWGIGRWRKRRQVVGWRGLYFIGALKGR